MSPSDESLPPSAGSRLSRARAIAGRLKGPLVAFAAVGAVLSGLVGYWNTWRTVREGVVPASTSLQPAAAVPGDVVPYSADDLRMTFAVLPFEAPADDAEARRRAQAASDTVQALQEARYLWARVAPRSVVAQALPAHPGLRQLGRAVRAHFFLRGTVLRRGESYALGLAVVDADTERVLHTIELMSRADAPISTSAINAALGTLTFMGVKHEVERARAKPDAALDVRDLTFRAYATSDPLEPAKAYARARSDLDRALALAADDLTALAAMAQLNLCECLRSWARDLGEMERVGTAALDRFLALRPDSPRMLALRSFVFLKHRRYEEALLVADDVLRREPDLGDAVALRVLALVRLGRGRDAVADVPQLLAVADNPTGLAVAAAAHFAAGDDVAAARLARQSLSRQPAHDLADAGDGAAALTLIAAETRAGRADAAAAALREFQRVVPHVRTVGQARAWLLPNSPVPDDPAFFDALGLASLAP